MAKSKSLTASEKKEILKTLEERFKNNARRHKNIEWKAVLAKLNKEDAKLWSLHKMELTGGEPDFVAYDKKSDTYIFYDCSTESPEGRRSLCYDDAALQARKANKPKDSAANMAATMGIELLTENDYQYLQQLGSFDLKTNSWLHTPPEMRKLGGALFGDCRFGRVFIYHNGVESYYAGRGFRGKVGV